MTNSIIDVIVKKTTTNSCFKLNHSYLRYIEYIRGIDKYGSIVVGIGDSNTHRNRKVLKHERG